MTVLAIVLAYLLGSVPFALILARGWGARDLHHRGSGNLGAANVLRTSGVKAGILVALLDITKGAASVLVAERLGGPGATPAMAGVAAVVGHVYPIWLKFRGGKGVATACGVFAVLAPFAASIAAGIFVAAVWWKKYVSLGSTLASVTLAPAALVTGRSFDVVIAAVSCAALILFRHRSNLARVRLGTERRIGVRV
jgi:glycerol-3-phosphate acyltransferase PlsY